MTSKRQAFSLQDILFLTSDRRAALAMTRVRLCDCLCTE